MWNEPTSGATSDSIPKALSVRGRLVNYRTGLSIAGSNVHLRGLSSAGLSDARTRTAADGSYSVLLPIGSYLVWVDEAQQGDIQLTGYGHRGDLFVDPTGACACIYGVVSDIHSHEHLEGAIVSVYRSYGRREELGVTSVTGPDGWYQLDFGCAWNYGTVNNAIVAVTHAEYPEEGVVLGADSITRTVRRFDFRMRRRRPH
jgi:hypothetical protein